MTTHHGELRVRAPAPALVEPELQGYLEKAPVASTCSPNPLLRRCVFRIRGGVAQSVEHAGRRPPCPTTGRSDDPYRSSRRGCGFESHPRYSASRGIRVITNTDARPDASTCSPNF